MIEEEMPDSHRALQLAKQGRLSIKEAIEAIVAGQLTVPVADLPVTERGKLTGWSPASVSKDDGSEWLVAFTLPELADAFCEQESGFPVKVDVDAAWVLETLPPQYGIVFNLNSDLSLEWTAQSVAKYRRDVLGIASTKSLLQ
jgi:hypothetical protein